MERNIPITDMAYCWDWVLPAIIYAYNTTPNRMTGFAPWELVYAEPPSIPGHFAWTETDTQNTDKPDIRLTRRILRASMRELQDMANQYQQRYIEARRKSEKTRRRTHGFQINDYVLIDNTDTKTGNAAKFGVNREGPYQIVQWHRNGNAILRNEDTPNETFQMHVSRLVKFNMPSLNTLKVRATPTVQQWDTHTHKLVTILKTLMISAPKCRSKHVTDLITPPLVAQFMSSLLGAEDSTVLELMAGDGAITKHYYEKRKVTAVEKDYQRAVKGKCELPKVEWLVADVTTPQFIIDMMERSRFDAVIANPMFNMGMHMGYRGCRPICQTNGCRQWAVIT